MSILDNFDVVGVPRTFSIAEVRILKNRISFNLATASEIGYPPFVRLFISRDKTQIALQPCAKETPNAMKFFTSDSTKDGKPKKRMIPVGNRALTALVKAGIGVEMNVPLSWKQINKMRYAMLMSITLSKRCLLRKQQGVLRMSSVSTSSIH